MAETTAEANSAEWEELQRVTRAAKYGKDDDNKNAAAADAGGGGRGRGGAGKKNNGASPTGSSGAGSRAGGGGGRRRRSRSPRQRKEKDRFGFFVDSGESLSSSGGDEVLSQDGADKEKRRPQNGGGSPGKAAGRRPNGAAKAESEREAEREKKWTKMMSDWDRTTHKRKKKLRRRLRKGVPNCVRGNAWTKLGNVPQKIDVDERGTYAELIRQSAEDGADAPADGDDPGLDENGSLVSQALAHDADRNRATPNATRETIERDINRTFPRHHLFAESSDESDFDCSDGDGGTDCDEDEKDLDDSDLAVSEKADEDKIPAWGDGDGDDQGMDVRAGSNSDLSKVGGGANAEAGGRGGALRRKSQERRHLQVSSAIVTAQKGGPSVGKKLLDAMQKCNANLDQVDMIVSSATVATVPTRAEMAAAEGKGIVSANDGGGVGEARGTTSSRKLSREERRELRRADYEGGTGGQANLRRVLRAYSVYDTDVGYCQGMNFIAAMFITFMSEEEAFWLLVAVMNEPPCKIRGLFGEGMSGAHQVLHVAERLIGQFLPKLSKHLEQENIHITMYATQWLLTVYTSSFPFELVARVWDCFLAEGWKIVYRVMLALLDLASPDLMELHFEEILGYFRELPSRVNGTAVFERTFSTEAVFERAFTIQLKHRQIEKYEKEWKARQKN